MSSTIFADCERGRSLSLYGDLRLKRSARGEDTSPVQPAVAYLRAFLRNIGNTRGALQDLSRRRGGGRGYLGDILDTSGKKNANPTLKTVDSVAAALGVRISEIFSETVFASPDAPGVPAERTADSVQPTLRSSPSGADESQRQRKQEEPGMPTTDYPAHLALYWILRTGLKTDAAAEAFRPELERCLGRFRSQSEPRPGRRRR